MKMNFNFKFQVFRIKPCAVCRQCRGSWEAGILKELVTYILIACLLLLMSGVAFGQDNIPPEHIKQTPPNVIQHLREEREFQTKPVNGYVPDTTTAVRIAEAVLIPIYGTKQIAYEKPFHATLSGDVWTISGTLHCKTTAKSVCVGGTAIVQLSKITGEVLLLGHEE